MIIDAAFLHNIQVCMSNSGNVNVFQWSRKWFCSQSLTLGSTWRRFLKFPDMDQKSFLASRASGHESWGGVGGDVIRPSATGKYFPFSLGNITSFALSLFWVDFLCVHRIQLLKVCDQYVTLPNSPAYRAYPRNNPGKTFFPNWWILDWSFAVIGWYSTNEPNGMIGPLNGFPKRLTYGVFSSDKRSVTFRR